MCGQLEAAHSELVFARESDRSNVMSMRTKINIDTANFLCYLKPHSYEASSYTKALTNYYK